MAGLGGLIAAITTAAERKRIVKDVRAPKRVIKTRKDAPIKPLSRISATLEERFGATPKKAVRAAPVKPLSRTSATVEERFGATPRKWKPGEREALTKAIHEFRDKKGASGKANVKNNDNLLDDLGQALGGALSETAKGAVGAVKFVAKPLLDNATREGPIGQPNILHELKKSTSPARKLTTRTYKGKEITLAQRAALPVAERKKVKVGEITIDDSPIAQVGRAGLNVLDLAARPAYVAGNNAIARIKRFQEEGLKGALLDRGSLPDLGPTIRGLTGKEKSLGSDVVKAAGVKNKALQTGLGFAFDFGVAGAYPASKGVSVARTLAIKEAKTAGKVVKKAGGSDADVLAAQHATYNKVLAANKHRGRGVKVKVGYVNVPGSARVTAAAFNASKKVASKVDFEAARKVRATARSVAHSVRPTISPTKEGSELYQAGLGHGRNAAAGLSADVRSNQATAVGLQKEIGKNVEDHKDIARQLEDNEITSPVAEVVRRDLDRARRDLVAAGVKVGDVTKKAQQNINAAGAKVRKRQEQLDKAADAEDIAIGKVGSVDENPLLTVIQASADTTKALKAWNKAKAAEAAALKRAKARLTEKNAEALIRAQADATITKKAHHSAVAAQKAAGSSATKGYRSQRGVGADHKRNSVADTRAARIAAEKRLKEAKAEYNVAKQDAKGAAKGYWTHQDKTALAEGRKQGASRGALPSSAKAASEHERKKLKPLHAQEGHNFDEHIPAPYLNQMNSLAHRRRRAEYDRNMFMEGDLYNGNPMSLTGSNRAYVMDNGRLTLANPKRIPANARVLNSDVIDLGAKRYNARDRSAMGTGVDNFQSVWKRMAILSPGFHVRNMIGDTMNAALRQPLAGVAADAWTGARVLRRGSQRDRSMKKILEPTPPIKRTARELVGKKRPTVTVKDKFGNKTQMNEDQIWDELIQYGVARQGYIAADVRDTAGQSGKIARGEAVSKVKTHSDRRWRQNREDLMRIATYIDGRKKGLSPQEAANRSLDTHFDYTQLSEFERNVARRASPFYTWSARNVPLQAKMLVRKPGKYAGFELFRQETAKYFGFPPDWQNTLSAFDASQLPIPFVHGGGKQAVSFGAPFVDVAQAPLALLQGKPVEQFRIWLDKFASMIGPVKVPIEVLTNYSTFFKGPIEREYGPIVPGPGFILEGLMEILPESLTRRLGIQSDFIDPRTGKVGWGWRAKADYVLKSVLPGPGTAALNLVQDGNARGATKAAILAGFASGMRVRPLDRKHDIGTSMTAKYNKRNPLQDRLIVLGKTDYHGKPINADNPTPEYTKIKKDIRQINEEIYALAKERGDRKLPREGGPSGKGTGRAFGEPGASGKGGGRAFGEPPS